MKRCDWCEEEKALDEFGRQTDSEDGRQPACKDCYARNLRDRHNIADRPPRPRRSPYDNMGEVLTQIEHALNCDDLDVAFRAIDDARLRYSL